MSARAGLLQSILLAVVGIAGIAMVQPGLAANVHKLRERDDVFLLPPPNQLRVLSLGYHSAAADALWAKLLLEYGIHGQEKRPFPDVIRYIDGIIALEPDYPLVYDFVDTILMYHYPVGDAEDARTARKYLERGMRERPYDANLHIHAGQFIAFMSASFLKDEKEIDRWRVDGAKMIARGVELGGDPNRSIAASTVLSKAGERKATIEHLQRAYAVADDPEDRAQFLRKLRAMEADDEAEQAITAVDRELAAYRFMPRSMGLLVGPRRSATLCAGPSSYERRGCARDWQTLVDEAK